MWYIEVFISHFHLSLLLKQVTKVSAVNILRDRVHHQDTLDVWLVYYYSFDPTYVSYSILWFGQIVYIPVAIKIILK